VRQRGWTFVEVVFVLAIFGLFLSMLVTIGEEMRRQEQRYRIDFMRHPQITAVMSRLRRDVVDAFGYEPYPATYKGYTQTPKTLIIYTILQSGAGQMVVWDFRNNGEARRIAYRGELILSDWTTKGVPDFEVSTYDFPSGKYAVRVRAKNRKGKLEIDQIFTHRAQ
jgi:hypothetical protein